MALGGTLGVVSSSARDRESQDQRRQDEGDREVGENRNHQARSPAYRQRINTKPCTASPINAATSKATTALAITTEGKERPRWRPQCEVSGLTRKVLIQTSGRFPPTKLTFPISLIIDHWLVEYASKLAEDLKLERASVL